MPLPTEELIIWANTDVNLPELAGPNKIKPIDDLINKGWDFTEKPAADEFNYILNNMGKWINWAITDIEAGTSLNTPNTLVRRDGSGNFFAGTINGTSFNGSTNITTNSWGTSRNFALTGSIVGDVSVDGSGNVSLSTAITDSGISILTGTIVHGGTIPLPSGFTESQCKWFVSNNSQVTALSTDGADDRTHLRCFTTGRVVSCYMSTKDSPDTVKETGVANYFIIGIK